MKNTILSIIITALGVIPITAAASAPAAPASAAAKPTARNLEWKWIGAAGASALGGVALWANSQHKHSKIGHERYPLMQRRNIIRALLAGTLETTERETLKDELAEINYRIERIHAKKSRLNLMRILGALVAIAGTATAVYGVRKKNPAAAAQA